MNQEENNQNGAVNEEMSAGVPVQNAVTQERRRTSIGGQALLEGIMMRGPKKTAMAVRNPAGEIVLESWETAGSKRGKFFRLPVIRGIFNFYDSLSFGYKCLMRSAEIAGLEEDDDDKKQSQDTPDTAEMTEEQKAEAEKIAAAKAEKKKKDEKVFMTAVSICSGLLSVVLVVGLFIWLPAQLYAWLPDKPFDPDNRYLRSVFEGLIKVLLLVGYMAAVSLMKDIRRTFMFHGAEHKTIFCYEAGLPLTVENVRRMKRFHPRCGTSFLILMVLVSIFVGFLIPPTLATPLRVLIKLALIPLIVGLGYELIKFAGRHDNLLTKIISLPGIGLQHLTVFEPDDSMIECAIRAIEAVIPDDGSDRW